MKQITVSPGKPNGVPTGNGQSVTSVIGPNESIFYPAGENLFAGQAIALIGGLAMRYDASQSNHKYTLVGIALNSALTGTVLAIATGPTVTVPGWGLTPGATYRAGLAGRLLTGSSDPAAVFSQIIGRAVSENEFVFTPQLIISK